MINIRESTQQASSYVVQAERAEEQGNLEGAFLNYRKAIDIFTPMLKLKNPAINALLPNINAYIDKAEMLSKLIEERKANPPPRATNNNNNNGNAHQSSPNSRATPNNQNGNGGEPVNELQQMMDQLALTLKECKKYTWNDVSGLHSVKETLNNIICVARQLAHLFTGNREAPHAVLLYGPPGVGKTLLGNVVASVCNMPFYYLSSADLVSKWVGESEKYIKALFAMAQAHEEGCVVFIDEIDSLGAQRSENGTGGNSSAKVVQEMLRQMNDLSEKGCVLIMGATNLPWALDDGLRRRFVERVYIPLPDEKTRKEMLKHYLNKNSHLLSEDDFDRCARETVDYSGDDICNLTKAAARYPIDVITNATHFIERQVDGKKRYQATSPDNPRAIHKPYSTFSADEYKLVDETPITGMHLRMAKARVKSSIDTNKLKRYDEWTEQYGVEG